MAATHHSTISRNSYSAYFDNNWQVPQETTTHADTSKRLQIIVNRSNTMHIAAYSYKRNTLIFRHSYVILQIARTGKETGRDHNGRFSHNRRSSQDAADIRGFYNSALAAKETARIQGRGNVAHRSPRPASVSFKEKQHSGEIKNAGQCQQSNNNPAAQELSVDWNPDDNSLSRTRRLLRILPYVVRCCQPLYNIWMSCKGGGWRWIP